MNKKYSLTGNLLVRLIIPILLILPKSEIGNTDNIDNNVDGK